MAPPTSDDANDALPPTDHVARVLLNAGARDAALLLLRAAVRRDDKEMACAALLRAIEARPDASVYGPELKLDDGLVGAYCRRGMLVEALAVLQGTHLGHTDAGRERRQILEELLTPLPSDAEPWMAEVQAQLESGGANVALTILDERRARGESPSPWARRRRDVLRNLLLDDAVAAQGAVARRSDSSSPLGRLLLERLAARDLPGALPRLRSFVIEQPNDDQARLALEVVERLANSLAAVAEEVAQAAQLPDGMTQPMSGLHVAMLQLRMGNLDTAERLFRKVVLDAPLDRRLRQHLDDVSCLQEVVRGFDATAATDGVDGLPGVTAGEPIATPRAREPVEMPKPKTVPRRSTSSAELLRKTQRSAPEDRGYLSGTPRQRPTDDSFWDEQATDVLSPEKEAELLLQQGFAEQALARYRGLLEIRQSPGLERRVQEIEAMMAARDMPVAAEVTVRRRLPELAARSRSPGDPPLAEFVSSAPPPPLLGGDDPTTPLELEPTLTMPAQRPNPPSGVDAAGTAESAVGEEHGAAAATDQGVSASSPSRKPPVGASPGDHAGVVLIRPIIAVH